MSNRFAKLIVGVFSLAMIAIASQRAEQNTDSTSYAGKDKVNHFSRKPASVEPKLLKHTMKIRGPLSTQLELVGEPVRKAGEVFVLRGVVSSREALNDIVIRWNIPAGLEIVRGQLKDTVAQITPGQPVAVEMTLKALTDQNLQVHFTVDGSKNSMRFGETSQYNTLNQDAIDKDLVRLKESNAREMLKEQQPGKVLH